MDNIAQMDWTHIQVFLAVADSGSLSGAARVLKVSQPTLGRQVRAAEAALEVELFHRHPRGLTLTTAGKALLEPARTMQAAAAKLSLTAAGQDNQLSGTVRITASDMVSFHLLPEIFANIRKAEPDIELELLATNAQQNLLFREADIAVRMYRSSQLDLIMRHVGDIELGMFAAQSYVREHGAPTSMQDIVNHPFVGYNDDTAIIDGMKRIGLNVDKHFFKTRCDQQVVHWELVRAGCGIGFAQKKIGAVDPLVEQILPDVPLPVLPVWLTAPEALHTNPRIRRVFDLLAEGLRDVTNT